MRKFLILFLCSVAFAQDAVVVELSQTDATQAKKLYDAKVAADAAWDSFNSDLRGKYRNFNDIQFSKDFRFIVPKPYVSGTTTNIWTWPSCGSCNACGTFTIPSNLPTTGLWTTPAITPLTPGSLTITSP
jgi:hypothetical protein